MKKIIIPGFQFAGIHAGIKDNVRKKDLSLIYSEEPDTLIDGVFTTNRVCAAPVEVCRQSLKNHVGRLVVINSGIANACTGSRGLKDALKTRDYASKKFGIKKNEVFVCSTGKIGHYLPMNKLLPGIDKAKSYLDEESFIETVKGIMTTDQFPKWAYATEKLGGKKFTIAVMAKGAGMIRPDMATMLAYVLTDLKFEQNALRTIFRKAVDETFNRITVDGDMSTNDTVLIMANGRAGNKPFAAKSPEGKKIEKLLTSLLEQMARKITLDGEGATKCCLLKVVGAASHTDAKKIAYAIGNSPLVKTALFGNDPNWGRIVAAVGYSGAEINPHKIDVKIGPFAVAKKGQSFPHQPKEVSRYMKKNQNMEMFVSVGGGSGHYHLFFSDLTYDYIHLNAEYHT